MSPVAVVRTSLSHFQRVALVKAQGIEAMRRLRPPVHFKREASFKAQVARWSETNLNEALDLLLDTEALCKTTGVPAEAACGRALFNVAARARVR
jgi:DNA polymerase-3 subunit delta